MVQRSGPKLRREESRSGFVYRRPSAEEIKERGQRKGGGMFDSIFKPGFDSYRAKVGENTVRILPATWEGAKYHAYTIWVHSRIGPNNGTYLCPARMKNKPCPICDGAQAAHSAGEVDESKALSAKEQAVQWIVDRDAKSPYPPILWTISWTLDRDINAQCKDKQTGKVVFVDHPDQGFDLYFSRSGQMLNTRYFGVQVAREPSPIDPSQKMQDKILQYIEENPIPSILKYYDADYLAKVLSGSKEESDELDKDDDDRDSRGREDGYDEDGDEVEDRGRGRRSVRDELEEDPDDRGSRRSRRDEPEEEEDDRRSSRRSRGRDEEEETGEEEARGSRRGRRDADEEGNGEDRRSTRRGRARDEEDPTEEEGDEDRGSRRGRSRREEEEGNGDDRRPSRRARGNGSDEEEEQGPRRSRRDEPEEDPEPRPRPRREREEEGGRRRARR